MTRFLCAFSVLVLAVFLDGEVESLRTGVSNFHPLILEVLPSFIAAFFLPIAYSILIGTKKNILRRSFGVTIGLVCYEFSQIYLAFATFDYYDLVSTLLGGALFVVIFYTYRYFKLVERINKEQP